MFELKSEIRDATRSTLNVWGFWGPMAHILVVTLANSEVSDEEETLARVYMPNRRSDLL